MRHSIDGVLLHEKKALPGAAQTLQYLNDHSIPFIFLTNGGGKHEHERVKELSEKLGVNFTVDNFVQSHTPFKALVHGEHGLENKTVLVTGADASKCRDIAEESVLPHLPWAASVLTCCRSSQVRLPQCYYAR
jgi:HAD superfamily hydrolase (TIGR01450 family)